MKSIAKIEKKARMRKADTFPALVSMIDKKTELTIKLESQLVAVEIEVAVPTKCIGYISVLTLHTVLEKPMAKKARYVINPINAKALPNPCHEVVYKLRYMLADIRRQDATTPGRVLNIINLLPILSMKNTAMNEPIAFIRANGMLSTIPCTLSSSLMLDMLIPVAKMIEGP